MQEMCNQRLNIIREGSPGKNRLQRSLNKLCNLWRKQIKTFQLIVNPRCWQVDKVKLIRSTSSSQGDAVIKQSPK